MSDTAQVELTSERVYAPALRQERRKAERDAAKRAPGQGAARGAGGGAAARADAHVNPVGDWTTQTSDHAALFRAVGDDVVKQRAGAGDREAQFSLGYRLVAETEVAGTLMGAAGRSPQADVRLARCTAYFPCLSRD
jgi:hypothetical protein